MARLNKIPERLIVKTINNCDLTDALFHFQNSVGISSGDVAGVVFSCGWDDEWPTATPTRRREMMMHYIDVERVKSGA